MILAATLLVTLIVSAREYGPLSEGEVAHLAKRAIRREGHPWGARQVEAMVELCRRESDFDPAEQNPKSSAYGLYQFLDGTWDTIKKTPNPFLQTLAAVRYIKTRYGTPECALAFHRRKGWY